MKIGEIWSPKNKIEDIIPEKYINDFTTIRYSSKVRILNLYSMDDGSEIVHYEYLKIDETASHERTDFLSFYEKSYE